MIIVVMFCYLSLFDLFRHHKKKKNKRINKMQKKEEEEEAMTSAPVM